MELQLRAVENDASVIEQFYKSKQKKFFKFKFNCNPLTGSQNIVITSNFSYDPLIFDLMTLKSTQFIGSARCPELNSNPSVSSNENAFTSYFCIHNEPITFDLSPHNARIYSVHWLCKIHT